MTFRPQEKGITLIEVLASVAMISLTLAAVYGAMVRINDYAMTSRLYTVAQSKAREQINQVLSAGPFNLKNSAIAVPGVLQLGARSTSTIIYIDPNDSTVKPLLTGSNTQATLPQNKALVTGTMTTVGEDFEISAGSGTATLRRIDVMIDYEYLGRPFRVELSTIRSSDL